ncbi:MAG: glycine zipper 2TM domain-containing protein [Novosphingobium sp.]
MQRPSVVTAVSGSHYHTGDSWNHSDRDRRGSRYRDRDDYRYQGRYRGEPVYANTRIWRGRDGRYYCRKENGTTGLLIGAAVGGVIGHEVAGYGDRTLGVLLGAAGGAILGRAIDRSNARCR